MGYKGKKVKKTLLTSDYIIDVSDTEMKVIQVGQTKYYAQDKQDLLTIAHELVRKGFSIAQIAKALSVSERQVRKYLEEC